MSPTKIQESIKNSSIVVEKRTNLSKSATSALRRNQSIPAIACGGGQEHIHLSLPPDSVAELLRNPNPLNVPFDLLLEKERLPVILREAQRDPVDRRLLHVDFLRLSKGSVITTNVPIDFLNKEKSVGLKRGGLLNIVRWNVEVVCPAFSIPKSITVDLSDLDIGDSVHIDSVQFPKEVHLTIQGRNFTLATIVSPASLSSQGARTSGEEKEDGTSPETSEEKDSSTQKEESEKKE